MKAIQILLKLITLLSTQLGFRLTQLLASFPTPAVAKERDLDIINSAQQIEFDRDGKKVALSWGTGPVVLLFHGWEGRSTHLAPIARALAKKGFQAIALDFTAHGLSQGRRCGFDHMLKDITALHNHVKQHISTDIHAMVGHSGGGFCMMASRIANQFKVKNFVVIASPLVPHPALDGIEKNLKASAGVMALVKKKIAQSFSTDWAAFENGSLYRPRFEDERLLLVFDEMDTVVSHDDAKNIQAYFTSAKIFKTQGLGHTKVLWDRAGIDEICEFLKL